MAPHGSNLPAAATESAKAARKNFFCELCSKGYARMNDFEAHEGSYDHQHRKRLKEMKHLTHSAQLSSTRNKPESSDLKSISLPKKSSAPNSTNEPPKKKAVFKPISAPQAHVSPAVQPSISLPTSGDLSTAAEMRDDSRAKQNGWWNERYVPGIISGCGAECGVCGGAGGGSIDLTK